MGIVPFHDHVLCKPRIILFLKHFIKFFRLGFHIRGGYIVNHKQDLVVNFRWRSLDGEENQLAQPHCVFSHERTQWKTIAIRQYQPQLDYLFAPLLLQVSQYLKHFQIP